MFLATGRPMKGASIVPDRAAHTLGHVTPARDMGPEVRDSLILGTDPDTTTRVHYGIMTFLAGEAAAQHARGLDIGDWAGVGYHEDSTDDKAALELAFTFLDSPEEGIALFNWLRARRPMW